MNVQYTYASVNEKKSMSATVKTVNQCVRACVSICGTSVFLSLFSSSSEPPQTRVFVYCRMQLQRVCAYDCVSLRRSKRTREGEWVMAKSEETQ